MDIGKAYQMIADKPEQWMRIFVLMLPNLFMAVLIVLAAYLLARLFRNLPGRLFNRFTNHLALSRLITQIVFLAVIASGLFIALGVLQLDKAVISLLSGVGIVGLALGFAFQDIAANFTSGVIIAVTYHCKMGDLVESNDFTGTVKKIYFRTTDILTFQGQMVLSPNKDIIQKPLKNHTSTGLRRVDLEIGVSCGEYLENLRRVAFSGLKNIAGQVNSKDSELFLKKFSDSSITFVLRVCNHFKNESDYLKAIVKYWSQLKMHLTAEVF